MTIPESIPQATAADLKWFWNHLELCSRRLVFGEFAAERVAVHFAREVERLKASDIQLSRQLDTAIMEREALRGQLGMLPARCDGLVSEVERLKRTDSEWAKICKQQQASWHESIRARERLIKEVERLEAELETRAKPTLDGVHAGELDRLHYDLDE